MGKVEYPIIGHLKGVPPGNIKRINYGIFLGYREIRE
jgi:hypothetical protein